MEREIGSRDSAESARSRDSANSGVLPTPETTPGTRTSTPEEGDQKSAKPESRDHPGSHDKTGSRVETEYDLGLRTNTLVTVGCLQE